MCDLIFGSGKGGSRHRLLNHRWNASRHFTQFVIAQSDPEFGNKRTVSILHIGQWKCHYVRDSIWDDTGGPPSLQWRLGSFFKKREFLSLWFESLLAKVNTGIWQTVIRLSRRTLCTFQKNMLNPYSHQLKSTTICTVRKWHTYLRSEQDHGCCLVVRLVVRSRGTAEEQQQGGEQKCCFKIERSFPLEASGRARRQQHTCRQTK